jgi:hypothetical protein
MALFGPANVWRSPGSVIQGTCSDAEDSTTQSARTFGQNQVPPFIGIQERRTVLKTGKQHGRKGHSEFGGKTASSRVSITDDLSWDGFERRKHRRFHVDWLGVLGRSSSTHRSAMDVRVFNVSEGGCCIHIDPSAAGQDSPWILGTEERLSLKLHVPGATLNAAVEVRWYMPVHSGIHGAGLEFISMSPKDRSVLVAALRSVSR